jgi:hypothetical protein
LYVIPEDQLPRKPMPSRLLCNGGVTKKGLVELK